MQTLRYFYEKHPEIYVIAAGSLLESLMGRHISFPVGRVEYMALHPCTFVEFLRAMEWFKKYMIVGGLPEAVANYAKYKDIVRLNGVFNALLSGYRDDVEKYASKPKEQDAIRFILNYGWTFAAHRIQFSKLLEKTLLLELVYPQTTASFPILPDLKKSPKLLWIDTGLVNYVAGMQEDLLFSKDTDELWNGDIAEHIVGQELLGSTFMFGEKRMFWVREAKNSQAEIDFLIRYRSHLIPIEVKTGNNAKLRSLHLFMDESKEKVALRLWNGPMTSDTVTTLKGKSFTLYNIPLYYAGYLEVFLDSISNTI